MTDQFHNPFLNGDALSPRVHEKLRRGFPRLQWKAPEGLLELGTPIVRRAKGGLWWVVNPIGVEDGIQGDELDGYIKYRSISLHERVNDDCCAIAFGVDAAQRVRMVEVWYDDVIPSLSLEAIEKVLADLVGLDIPYPPTPTSVCNMQWLRREFTRVLWDVAGPEHLRQEREIPFAAGSEVGAQATMTMGELTKVAAGGHLGVIGNGLNPLD